MTISELRRLYQQQLLVDAIIELSTQQSSTDWIVEFRRLDGRLVLLTDDSGQECHYLTADDA